MSLSSEVMDLIDALVAIRTPDPTVVGKTLKVTLAETQNTPKYERHEGHLASGPFDKVETGHLKTTSLGQIVLSAREGAPVKQSELDLKRFGPLTSPIINPHVKPEGTISHEFSWDNGAFKIIFAFRAQSKVLRDVVLAWSTPSQPPKPH